MLNPITKRNGAKPLIALGSQSKHNACVIVRRKGELERAHVGVGNPADGSLVRCGGGGDMTAFA